MTKSCVSFLSMPHPHKMSDINFGTQGRNVCMGFCKKVSVCKLQRGEYLMRRHDFGKNSLPARAMEEDTNTFARAPKNATSCPPHDPPTPMWVSRDCREQNNCSKYGKCYWSVAIYIYIYIHTYFSCKTRK